MRTKEQLLADMKQNKANRIKALTYKSQDELVAFIEAIGHFDKTNADIAWLENEIKKDNGQKV